MKQLTINRTQQERPVCFAAEELKRYLVRMGAPALRINIGFRAASSSSTEGEDQELPWGTLSDPALDDAYEINVDGPRGEGHILASNPRAVLIAAYRYLTLIGCRFLAPGEEHESVPVLTDPLSFSARESHTASLRHRGACLEGANSIEDILRFIDWSPKVGYNSFFFQFETPKTFLERYYFHLGSTLQKPEFWTMEDTRRVMPFFDEELQKRGLITHRVGHGWTAKALGCSETGWEKSDRTFDEETTSLMAKVNGKQALWGGVPTNTNLCLSNPLARERFIRPVVTYLKENPSTDYLHIWLADDRNNSCECENCRKKRPSDWYVLLLNELDEALTEEGIDTRLVMLLYVDLLWAPKEEKIRHPERFLLMFAPITRTFKKSFSDILEENVGSAGTEEKGTASGDWTSIYPLTDEPTFKLNHLTIPRELETNLGFLRSWQEQAFLRPGFDCFDYDYYMGRAHYGDPTYVRIARTIVGDMKSHRKLGLNGYNSCQELRSQFPNGLANYCLARASVDTSLTYEELAKEYYLACYGKFGLELLPIMEELSECFDPDYVMLGTPRRDPEYHERLKKGVRLMEEKLRPMLGWGLGMPDAAIRREGLTGLQLRFWKKLSDWHIYADIYLRMMLACTEEEIPAAKEIFEKEFMSFISRLELEEPGLLDVYRLHEILRRTIETER